jgi:hypothetical protein
MKSNSKKATTTFLPPIFILASVLYICLVSMIQFSRDCTVLLPYNNDADLTFINDKHETTGTSPLSLSSYNYQQYHKTEYVPAFFEHYVHQNAESLGLKHTSFNPSGCYLWGYNDTILASSGAPLPNEAEKMQLQRVPSNIQEEYLNHIQHMRQYQDFILKEFQLRLPTIVTGKLDGKSIASENNYSDIRHALRYYNHSLVCNSLLVPWGGSALNSRATTRLLSHIKHLGNSKSDKQFLEPLLPQLRHADICVNKKAHMMDMKYMVHDFRFICNTMTPHTRTILVDMGGSLIFHKGQNPIIVLSDLYKKFGIHFDHVYAYEMTPFTPNQTKTLFASLIPDDWQTSYHWINTGVDSTVNVNLNPFSMIKKYFLPEDLVVVKLDIDTPSIELPLAHELLNDPSLHSLIDQFYFEYHVKLKELNDWRGRTQGSIYDAMHLMTQLREKGVAAHFWV